MWSGRNPGPPSASLSVSVWGSWPRQEAHSLYQPSPSERLLIERMVYPGHKSGGGHNLTPFQKLVIQPEMFPLPRLRFLEAVGVLLEKHNTPSQEFHEEKRGSRKGRIWGSACCVSTCCSVFPRQQAEQGRAQSGCCWLLWDLGYCKGQGGSPGEGHTPRQDLLPPGRGTED